IPHSGTILNELVQAQIIEALPDGTAYRFRHGLTRAVVYESLSRLQRQKLHRAAADFWMEQPESDRTLLVTAYHLGKSGMLTRAMELIANAASQAEEDQEISRAIELYSHALEMFPHDESVRKQLERLQGLQAG
ncbi:MAG: hypothetical protein JW910_11150, partial [Anaerolineae bacterium]|nr:hypothetical protein [Anaerolineae bacterium]